MTTSIVPFGKYKGQPIEALAADREYCDWLTSQDWFRTKFVGIHTLIVNHFGEPNETPEHNALQARFLDDTWCQRFALCTGFEEHAKYKNRKFRERFDVRHQQLQEEKQSWLKRRVVNADPLSWEAKQSEYYDEALKHLCSGADKFDQAWWMFTPEVEFEVEGVDVVLSAWLSPSCAFFKQDFGSGGTSPHEHIDADITREFRIECKPIVGDDYPAILRQMKAAKAKYLVAGAVRSSVLSVDQVSDIFSKSDVSLLTVEAIADRALVWNLDEAPF